MGEGESSLKMMPQDIEAEQAALGAVLLDQQATIARAQVRAEDFYKTTHRVIFSAMEGMQERREQIDLVTLTAELRKSEYEKLLPQDFGIASYLNALLSVPTASNYQAHEAIVVAMAQRRRIIQLAAEAQQAAYEFRGVDEIVSGHISKLNDVRRIGAGEIVPYSEVVNAGYDGIERRCENPGILTGVPTGFAGIDRMTNGWQPGWKYTIAGRPGMGKTAFAMQSAGAGAAAGPVGIVSLEMTREQIALRDISRESGIPLSRLLAGTVRDDDWPRLTAAANALHGRKIHCGFAAFDGAQEVRVIDDMVQRLGCILIIVDYLQLQKIRDHRGNREQEVSALSSMHKRKAKEHNVPVIELSQLNREVERRQSRRPTLADLRESGSIEQDADFVGFIWGEECKCPRDRDCLCGNRHKRTFSGAKGRMNEIGDVELVWEGKTTSFRDGEGG